MSAKLTGRAPIGGAASVPCGTLRCPGTAASVGIDAALIAKDVGAFDKKETVNIDKPLLKNNITKLEDPKPTVIDMTQNKVSNTQVSLLLKRIEIAPLALTRDHFPYTILNRSIVSCQTRPW